MPMIVGIYSGFGKEGIQSKPKLSLKPGSKAVDPEDCGIKELARLSEKRFTKDNLVLKRITNHNHGLTA
jgi:hypothetical protein